jgi:hypothetical protein
MNPEPLTRWRQQRTERVHDPAAEAIVRRQVEESLVASVLQIIEIPLSAIRASSTLGRLFVCEGLGKWGESTTGAGFHRRLLDDDISSLASRVDPDVVVSVMGEEERTTWSMGRLPLALSRRGIGYIEFPLMEGSDDGVDRLLAAGLAARSALLRQQRVVIMARGLHGRSARVVMAILMLLGLRADTAARRIAGANGKLPIQTLTLAGEHLSDYVRDACVAMSRPERLGIAPHARAIAAFMELANGSTVALDVGSIAMAVGTVLARHGTLNARRLGEEMRRSFRGDSSLGLGARQWQDWLRRINLESGTGISLLAEDICDLDERSLVGLMGAQVPIAYYCHDDPERRSDLATLSAQLLSWHPDVALAARWVADLFATVFQRRPSEDPDSLALLQLERLRSDASMDGLAVTRRVLQAFLTDVAAALNDRSNVLPTDVAYAPVLKALQRARWRPEETWWREAFGEGSLRIVDCVSAMEHSMQSETPLPKTATALAMEVVARTHELGYESIRNASYIKGGVASFRFSLSTERSFQAKRRRPDDDHAPFLQANINDETNHGESGIAAVFFTRGHPAGPPRRRFYPLSWGPLRVAESIAAHEAVRCREQECTFANPDHVEWYRKVVDVAGTHGVLVYGFDREFDGTEDVVLDAPLPHVVRFPCTMETIELPGRRWVHAGRPHIPKK